ncbi:MAG: divalent metal cation transporter [Chloroflexi bacterium]|nr:MAG: divalent metal cation transporter [Chloroflexota bacterium]
MATRAQKVVRERSPAKRVALLLGPGFITGVADDDPSGIGTYSVAGASLGLATLWTALLTFPLMAAVQNICARLGLVAGHGLAGILRRYYPRPVLYAAVAIVLVANTINLGADLGAIADALGIVSGVRAVWMAVPVAVGILALQIFASYHVIERVFKVLTLALLAYVAEAVLVHPDLGETLRATFVPTVVLDQNYVTTLVAILGTTISPYLFFWQASHEVEEEKESGNPKAEKRGATRLQLRIATIDVNIGMFISNLVMYFIILATAVTLHASGKTEIQTGADAAEALRPVAGDLAGWLFAAGMIGTGLLAIPVLSGSAAYAVSEALNLRRGLNEDWRRAKAFYGVIAVATLVGVVLNFTPIKPIDALYWSSVLNGIAAPPLLVLIMLAARNRRVMGDQPIGPVLTLLGWATTIAMFLALLGLVISSLAS